MVKEKTWVKICGTTTLEDAMAAVQAGADAIGFIFTTSPREVTRETASGILNAMPDPVLTIGVVANEPPDYVKALLRLCPVRGLQFHGQEPPEEVLAFRHDVKFLIKTIRVKDEKSIDRIPDYKGVDAVLLDAYWPGRLGGTGKPFPRELALKAKQHGIPIIVAGGLDPSNVRELVREVAPFGVDVVSGVEQSPGKKDNDLVRKFVQMAKNVV
ncbi:MAG: phosphoribosylanthranilate isomerase [Candidatus Omnitrophica bacterium]|nr:phosphoribosylanthranilate isomerase [Candidatus Omnitrophota bacterium]